MARRNLQDWASIAEVIGAIAVVISLLYVGFQVKENTGEVRAANRQQLVNRSFAATHGASANPELAAIVAKLADGKSLTPAESVLYGYFVRGMLYDIQEAYLLYLEGRLDEEYWQTRAAIAMAYMTNAPARDVYHRDKSIGALHQSFVKWMDQSISEVQYN